ncbi:MULTISPECIES: glutathione transferase GstA [Providencia]|uniref:Glutathione S-transferase n=2 Tax=Providencia TaxID=586 RepID=A0A2A5Q6W3_PRORE|nr:MULTISPECIES: glutathione transferase GstA [Providencia]MRF66306.1 glutathione transferase GstA [Escherichia coli]EHZ6873715.1 glutathione transferase GstA [Providencia rettgeri]MBG5926879.1 glutathione transferase GstA [Providencia rettgeri]MBI6188244.1 glutathione transferase GstA [Providencia rettgeri]MBN6366757.1 glutathione transferase GstA [Providencia rettgeri]
MKLYYAPGACSLSPHIILRETGLDFSIERVNIKEKKTEKGEDFLAINPKGQVPTLVLDNGEQLTEGAVIVQYIADQKPDRNLIALPGSMKRYHQLEALNFISTELHKNFSPLFTPGTPEEYKDTVRNVLFNKFAYVDNVLAKQAFFAGDTFSVADAYLFTVSNWAKHVGLDLTSLTHLQDYSAKIAKRPNVQDALKAEGLI